MEKVQFERNCPKAFFDGYDREPALKNYEGITVQFKMSGMYLTVQPTEEAINTWFMIRNFMKFQEMPVEIQKILSESNVCQPEK